METLVIFTFGWMIGAFCYHLIFVDQKKQKCIEKKDEKVGK